jgi:hypothetical protein
MELQFLVPIVATQNITIQRNDEVIRSLNDENSKKPF